jgi:hypothetical protein
VDLKRNKVCRCGLDSIASGQGTIEDSFDHGNEPPGSIKGRKLLEQLSDYQLFI